MSKGSTTWPCCQTSTGPVRHAEKRRTSSCRFADRIARFCVDHYREYVPLPFQEEQKQTCLASIVAFLQEEEEEEPPRKESSGRLFLLGMGVGTKFLSKDALCMEDMGCKRDGDLTMGSQPYGQRVRDCHAEVLARRALRRQLALSMHHDLKSKSAKVVTVREFPPILERVSRENGSFVYRLRSNVSLHMYTSSAPCGNATLKKFATMKKVSFREDLGDNEWPREAHEPMLGHSIPLGQFALLVKKDPGSCSEQTPILFNRHGAFPDLNSTLLVARLSKKQCDFPIHKTTAWCPPGTSTVWSNQGSLHTCSDKICRWNVLGLQGALLASLLERPLYMASLTVGRKLTECICRRAVCCRAAAGKPKTKNWMPSNGAKDNGALDCGYTINHPAILGTAVYMDDEGVIENQIVRFHSALSWAWWPAIGLDDTPGHSNGTRTAECIDGATGYLVASAENATLARQSTTLGRCQSIVSRISTAALLDLHQRVAALMEQGLDDVVKSPSVLTLADLRAYKRHLSPTYELQKRKLLSKHPLFRQWKRRFTDDNAEMGNVSSRE